VTITLNPPIRYMRFEMEKCSHFGPRFFDLGVPLGPYNYEPRFQEHEVSGCTCHGHCNA